MRIRAGIIAILFLLSSVVAMPAGPVAAATFPDVPASYPYAAAIGALSDQQIIRGFPNGTFQPEANTLRAQMAALIARAMGWANETGENRFTDQGPVDPQLWQNVGALARRGVARGYSDADCVALGRTPPCYLPTENVLYAQSISFITRAMVTAGRWQPQPNNPALYPNVPLNSGHREDLATYVKYAGAVPGTTPEANWGGWNQAAIRGWFAQALYQALNPGTKAGAPYAAIEGTVQALHTGGNGYNAYIQLNDITGRNAMSFGLQYDINDASSFDPAGRAVISYKLQRVNIDARSYQYTTLAPADNNPHLLRLEWHTVETCRSGLCRLNGTAALYVDGTFLATYPMFYQVSPAFLETGQPRMIYVVQGGAQNGGDPVNDTIADVTTASNANNPGMSGGANPFATWAPGAICDAPIDQCPNGTGQNWGMRIAEISPGGAVRGGQGSDFRVTGVVSRNINGDWDTANPLPYAGVTIAQVWCPTPSTCR